MTLPPHLRSLRTRHPAGAFSLIELLVVIAVIAILAGLLLQVSGYVQEKAARSRAQTEIAALEAALESYKIDNGTYPEQPSAPGQTSTKILIDELFPASTDEKVYFEIPANMLSDTAKTKTYDARVRASTHLVDPFGNPYYYRFPGDPNRSGSAFFDLYSLGQKGKANDSTDNQNNLWIKNW